MRAALSLLALLLIGCAAPPARQSYRDTARPISSMVVLEAARLDGAWHQVAGFGPGCAAPSLLTISGSASRIDGQGCFLPLGGAAAMNPSGPGRFTIAGKDYWLLWVDFDYRTIVIGTPSGDFGAILNRGGPIPEDRLEAARRILAFNGYDLSRLTRR